MPRQRKYKTFWPRFWAGIVDSLILGLLGGVLNLALAPFGLSPSMKGELYIALSVFYNTYFTYRYGQTIGKRWNGIAVIDVSETGLLPFHRAMAREAVGWAQLIHYVAVELFAFLPLLATVLFLITTFWFPIEVITMLLNPKRRAVHDFLAGSVVVRADEVPFETIARQRA